MDRPQAETGKGSILIVDDDLSARQTLTALLEAEGYEVRCAPSGQTALLFAGEEPPDLLLLDVRLPDLDGFEVCRRLKEGEGTRGMPVIFLSALEEGPDKVKGFAAGGADYITKPFHAEEVLARVQTHVVLYRMRCNLEQLVGDRTRALSRSEAALRERLRFEMLLNHLSARFVGVAADKVDHEVEDGLARVCEFLGTEAAVLWQWSVDNPHSLTLTHLYRPLGGPPVPHEMAAHEYFPWCLREVQAGRIVTVRSMEDLPAEATRDRAVYQHYGVKSAVTFPLLAGDESPIGALNFSAMREERAWPEEIVQRLQLIAQIFANALARKRADAALRKSEARLSVAAASADAGLWELDLETGRFWTTDKARQLFGIPLDGDLTLERFLTFVHPEDRERVRSAVERLKSSSETIRVEYRRLHPDGTVGWMVSRGRRNPAASEGAARLMGVTFDVTERKEMEKALAESQVQLLALINSTDDLVWAVDPERFGLITFNRGLSDYFLHDLGITIQAGMTPGDLLPPEYAAKWRDFYSRALRESKLVTEYEVSAKTRVLLLSLHTLRREHEIFGISVFAKDITERKRAEAALREGEERFRQVAETVGDFIWEVDPTGLYSYTSPSVERILGYRTDELVGKLHFYDLFVPEVREEYRAAAFKIIEAREPFRAFVNRNVRKDGKVVYLETSGVPIVDAAGALMGYRGADTDVTTQYHAEVETSRLRQELAHISRVTLLGELTASLAHELNQPLTAIASNAYAGERYLAMPVPRLDEVREILVDVAADARRAGEVIHRLRTLLKKDTARFCPMDLNEVIQEVVVLTRSDAIIRHQPIALALTPDLPPVLGDRVQLQQVLLNLVLNGMDAMADQALRERQLTILTVRDAGAVRVGVRDRGRGIPAGRLEQVFTAFVTTKPGGMGMGLAISRSIVEAHGGKIWAENNPEGGATFWFTLSFSTSGNPAESPSGAGETLR